MGSSVILPTPGQPREGPDPAFKSAAIPNVVSFGFAGIDPPASVYIQRDDVLVIEGFTQAAGDTVTVIARLLIPLAPQPGQPDHLPGPPADPRGQIGPGYIQTVQRSLVLTSSRALFNLTIPLMEGYLLSVCAVALASGSRGQTFVRAFLNRGIFSASSPNVSAILFADYSTPFAPVGWPAGRFLSPTDGPGFFQHYSPANPAAGADIAFSSNTSGRVRIESFAATFTASAVVANRVPRFVFSTTSSGFADFTCQDTVAVTASQVVRYSLSGGTSTSRGAGAGTAANPLVVVLPLPSPALSVLGAVLNSFTQGIDPGDQWSNIQVGTEEWFDGVF